MVGNEDMDLTVRIRGDVDGARRAFGDVTRDLDRFHQRATSQLGALDRTFRRFDAAASTVVRGLAAIGVGLSVGALTRYADAWRGVQNQLTTATGTTAEATKAMDDLFGVAQRTRTEFETNAQLYARLSVAGKELGATQAELIAFTEGVGQALAVSGASATSASGALLQLSQAIGAGTVRAEEFNSILEAAPRIAQAVADGLDRAGGSVARLRGEIIEGRVSSTEFFNAFLTQLPALEREFSATESTVGQALTALDNSLTRLIGRADEMTSFSSVIAGTIQNIAAALDGLASAGRPAFVFGDELDKAREQAEALRVEITALGEVDGRSATRQRAALGIRLGALEAVDAFREIARLQEDIAERQDELAGLGKVRGRSARTTALQVEIADLQKQAVAVQLAIDSAARTTAGSLQNVTTLAKPVNDNLDALEAKLFGLEGAWEAFGAGGRDALEATEEHFEMLRDAEELADQFNRANAKAIETGDAMKRTADDYLPVVEQIADAEERRQNALAIADVQARLRAELSFARDRLEFGEREAAILREINQLRAAGIDVSEDQAAAIRRTVEETARLNDRWDEQQELTRADGEAAKVAAAPPQRRFRLATHLDAMEEAA